MERPVKPDLAYHPGNTRDYIVDLENYCTKLEDCNVNLAQEILCLTDRDRFLIALETAGVDNWEGYEEAQRIFEEES